jgi:hypothetical protein
MKAVANVPPITIRMPGTLKKIAALPPITIALIINPAPLSNPMMVARSMGPSHTLIVISDRFAKKDAAAVTMFDTDRPSKPIDEMEEPVQSAVA